jgi:RHS repeat-associated protein
VMVDHDTEGEHFAGYDGNGNVMSLVNAEDSSIVAMYEYGPFGEVIRATGPMAEVNPLRFSTKYQDGETGLNYYGFRFYGSNQGRWLSQDPIGEAIDRNLYGFIANRSPNEYDVLGLFSYIEGGSHFFNGAGRSKTIAFVEVDNNIHPADFPGFDDIRNTACQKCSTEPVGLTSRPQNVRGGPGRITFQLNGELTAKGGSWRFDGKVTANDEMFDFNWLPWGQRTWYNELATRVIGTVGHALGGKDYLMRFYGHRETWYSGKCPE